MPWSFADFFGGIGLGIIILVTAISLVFSTIAPTATAKISELGKGSIGRSWWIGFLTFSVLIGGAIVLAMTIIGLLATPVIALIVALTALAGLVAVLRDALTGIITAVLIQFVPFVGWIALWLVVLFGIGLLSRWLFQPPLFKPDAALGGDAS